MIQNKFINGQIITPKELFTGNNKIVIPDLQRDYTWGDKKHIDGNTDLVSGFVNNLIEVFNKDKIKKNQLGLIYAYEEPDNFINIADGQQRLTTLFLLLGVLYRNINNNEDNENEIKEIKNCLMSDFEEKDDKESRLQYAVRESTLYFLSDLSYHYFIKKEYNKIKESSWYYTEYDNDPSIQSMISAIKIIENAVKEDKNKENFAKWIINNIQFFYFDIGSRTKGEETFVIINTTGEPLTATENLKPLLLGDIDEKNRKELSQIWETWEKYFWKNKKEKEHEADKGFEQFLTWYCQATNKKEDINLLKCVKNTKNKAELVKDINAYFEQYKILVGYFEKEKFKKIFESINKSVKIPRDFNLNQQLRVIVPLLAYMVKLSKNKNFKEEEKEEKYRLFLRRLRKNNFDKEWKERNENYIELMYLLQIIEKSKKEENVLNFDGKFENSKAKWYNDEEKIKDKLKEQNKNIIEEWEDYEDFMGDISILFKAYLINENDDKIPTIKNIKYDINELKRIFSNYQDTIGILKNKGDKKKYLISNLFRLFRLFSNIVRIGHIPKTSKIRGASFSAHDTERKHFTSVDFIKLLKSNDYINFCLKYIKIKIEEEEIFKNTYDNDNNVDKFIKSWLSLKVFNANKEKTILEYYEGNKSDVAVYEELENNRIYDTDFSLDNSICGFAVPSGWGKKSYIKYTNKDMWEKPNIINTTFAGIKFQEFENTDIKTRNVLTEEIEKNKNKIDEIIKYIKSL